MALADYQPESREVNFKGGSFNVEAISLSRLTTLIRVRLNDLEGLYDLYQQRKGTFKDGEVETLISGLMSDAPGLAADIIAVAASGNEGVEWETLAPYAAKLPFGVQMQALLDIVQMTFDEVGSVKKFLEAVTPFLERMKTEVASLKKN